ncbi:MAG: transcriptional repressor LexA [Eubacteriales bacterium]|nr:transcriptional repressor LexA [Eubacteriales bacterium]
MNKELREKQIYDYIVEYVNNNGFAPSMREICKGLSISSTSTVQGYIKRLSEKGLISRMEQKKRAIMPVESQRSKIISAPLLGTIVAGQPLVEFENIEGYIQLPDIYGSSDDLFILKVHGDSMIEKGIHEGDYIIVKQQRTAENGDVVVAMVDDATTVKTYYNENNMIRLQPENADYQPIISDKVYIVGKVLGLHRIF